MSKPKNAKSPWQPESTFDEPGYVKVLVTDGKETWFAFWYSSFKWMEPNKPFTHWMPIPPLPEGER